MPFANHDGVRIHYEVEGEGQGPPLVLVAGFTISTEAWRMWGYVDALKHDYRLILLDPRGHGASDKPHDPSAYGMDKRAADIIAVLDDLGLERVHYLGYSMGGRIGYDTAKLAPTRLRSLMIGGSTPFAVHTTSQRTQMFSGGMEAMVERQPLPPEVKTPAFRAMMLANDVEALVASAIDRPSVEDILPRLTMPCLLYAGDADGSHARIQQCADLMPNGTFVSIPGVDHWAGIYRSDLVLPHLRAFLKRVTQDEGAVE